VPRDDAVPADHPVGGHDGNEEDFHVEARDGKENVLNYMKFQFITS
jgi:hypothetical protein